MELNQNNLRDDKDDQNAQQQYGKADGRATDTEKVDPIIQQHAMEGQPMGGQNFGEEGGATPMGDDKDNPSRTAGYTNAYFARTAPADEDTANNNFKAARQQGEPDYDGAHGAAPGPQEVPEQQKVGGADDTDQQQSSEESYHEPELGEQQPDHGSSGTETGEEKDHIET